MARYLAKKMPTREEMGENRFLKPIAHRILRPELWRFTRRSVPRGVALGMLAAFLVPVGQIFVAAFLALPVRANVPIAALVTFITNPLTYAFWVVTANQVGKFALAMDAMTTGKINEQMDSGAMAWFSSFIEAAGVTAFGFVILAVVFASLGYVISGFVWTQLVVRRRARAISAIRMRQLSADDPI
jgi:hypothetical protein